ncbi:MAG: hypothetical protein ABI261_04235 [Ginsengibacter sp.]
MKKKQLFFLALVIMLGTAVSGCYVDRGYYHPHYHHYHHYWHSY